MPEKASTTTIARFVTANDWSVPGQTFDLRRLTENDRARFDNSVRNGKNQMPPWKGVLTDEEIDQAWHYIRSNAYQK